ncbi:MAG: glycosyltransferase family protein [Bacteroidota bacterium]|nr:glycosyltransferase family protein [Bacteroidota bacterium]
MTLSKQFNILVCPLEWGLGHAGRMIPLVRRLQEKGHNVFIGAGSELQRFFRSELTGVKYIDFRGFSPSYSVQLPQYAALLMRLPVLIFHIIAEHIRLKRIIKDNKIDIVISDNRFGLWNRKIKSIYLTHQVRIPFPEKFRSLEWIGTGFHRFIIKKYSFCFIPDLPGELNLSGRLSHGVNMTLTTRFIGILSRFTDCYPSQHPEKESFPDITIILSGPEPQKGILRQILVGIFKEKELKVVILEGKPGTIEPVTRIGNTISYNHLSSGEMAELLSGSKNIITRSGYTSIMELVSLNRSALLIPTPGQTEQEYLARYLSAKGWFMTVSQRALNLETVLLPPKQFDSVKMVAESRILLEEALDEILK